MADISQIKLSNGTTYDIKDAVARAKADVYYVVGPSTDTTAGTWTGSLDGLTAYYDGLTLIYVPNVAGVSGGTKLNINGLGEINCYLTDKGSIAALTTHYPAGTPIPFTYVNGKFIHADYSRANDNTTVICDLHHNVGPFKANSAVYRYQMLFQMDQDQVTPMNNVSNGYNKTNKTMLTSVEFDPFGNIFYYNTTTTVSANSNVGVASCLYAKGTVDLRYSFNISASVNPLTASKDVYMKVTPLSNGKCKIAAAHPLVSALPSTADGYWYIFLGRADASTLYYMSLYPWHPVYACEGKIVNNNTFALKGKASLEWNATDESIDFVFM